MFRNVQTEQGFTLIEVLVVVVIVGILAAMATVSFGGSSVQAYKVTMKTDLRNIATAQAAYIEQNFAENGVARYAGNVNDLPVTLSNGVTIRMRGNANGWSARATHPRATGARCAVVYGTVNAFAPATEEGKITCD